MMNGGQFLIHHSAFIVRRLRRLRDLARLDAGGADLHAHRAALRALDADGLQIGIKAPRGAVVRVRDVVAELRALAADFASFSHNGRYLRRITRRAALFVASYSD